MEEKEEVVVVCVVYHCYIVRIRLQLSRARRIVEAATLRRKGNVACGDDADGNPFKLDLAKPLVAMCVPCIAPRMGNCRDKA